MRTIENKQTTMRKEGGTMSYGDLIKLCVEAPSEKGFTVSEMSLSLKVFDKISKKKIELEDTEYELVKSKVDSMKWGVIHKDIVVFSDDVNNAK